MELPSFDLLWHSSAKLAELESVIETIDQKAINVVSSSAFVLPRRLFVSVSHTIKKPKGRRVWRHRGSLHGVRFHGEDQQYYQPIRHCCDEPFYTEKAYTSHVQQHVEVSMCLFVFANNPLQCDVLSCPFTGSGKLLRLHKEVVRALLSCPPHHSFLAGAQRRTVP